MSQSSIVLRLWRTDATEKVDRRLEDVFVNHWPTCFVAKKWKQVTHWKFSKEFWEGISTRSFPLWLSIRWIACSERHEVKKGDSLFFPDANWCPRVRFLVCYLVMSLVRFSSLVVLSLSGSSFTELQELVTFLTGPEVFSLNHFAHVNW